MSAWPSMACTERRSAPPSSRWLAKECRNTCGDTRRVTPAVRAAQRTVAEPAWRRHVRTLHHRRGAGGRQRLWERPAEAWTFDVLGRITAHGSLAHQVASEAAEGGEPAGHARGLETDPREVLEVR